MAPRNQPIRSKMNSEQYQAQYTCYRKCAEEGNTVTPSGSSRLELKSSIVLFANTLGNGNVWELKSMRTETV